MDSERWLRVKDLFHAALSCEPQSRGAYLLSACGDDMALRREVESLLGSHERASSFIELTAAEEGNRGAAWEGRRASAALIGRRLGPYRLTDELGTGGMGVVYRAVRADEAYQQAVAVKIIREAGGVHAAGLSEALRRRFRVERQLLADLDHPSIVRLLDGGTTDDGVTYLVMECIAGTPIDRYCESRDLSLRARVELFCKVCDAVHYAHQHLVVHRDLKPGNILVTDEGVPKLLDFGIAKLVEPSAVSEEATTSPLLMTPAYASPEQFQSRAVTTASDVYALCVVLYELLCGRRPYSLEGLAIHEAARVICEETPVPPSAARAGEPGAPLRRTQLVGDLDAIVMKGLAKEPRRRYASAEQLADDLRRYLDGRPVLARPDTLLYRGAKFVRRHRLATAAVLLAMLGIAGGSAAALWQAQQARAARDAAEESRRLAEKKTETAERISTFLQDILGAATPGFARGRDTAVLSDLLEQTNRKIDTQLADQPEVAAAVHDVIGRTYQSLGKLDTAERHLRAALELRRQRLGDDHADTVTSVTHLTKLMFARGDLKGAEPLVRETLTRQKRLLGEEHVDVATTLNNLASLLYSDGQLDEAAALFRDALAMRARLLGRRHRHVAQSLNNLATVLKAQRAYDAAEPMLREALTLNRELLGNDHPETAQSCNNLAALWWEMGRFDDAEPLYRETLALRERLLGARHPDVAESLSNLGVMAHTRGRDAEAEPLLRRALEIRREALGASHALVAGTLGNLASVVQAQGRLDEAAELFEQALRVHREQFGDAHALVASDRHNLGVLAQLCGRLEDADAQLTAALEIRRALFGERHLDVAESLTALAALESERGEADEARQHYEAALEIERELGGGHPRIAVSLAGLGKVLMQGGEIAPAEARLREALTVREGAYPADHPEVAHSRALLGELLILSGRAAEGEPLLRAALDVLVQRTPTAWPTARTRSLLGACLAAQQRFDEAAPALLEADAALAAVRGPRDPLRIESLQRLVDLYEGWGQPDEAERWREALAQHGEE
ncbi:MAG: Serine/threonine-protein kinase PknD [Phycisphaerae bacterium]|nr:Serine/threonine-protein kinase PknD [Phycisphaerae bacterium]